jgi:branched-chain amino acid transport system substrate-binding protein
MSTRRIVAALLAPPMALAATAVAAPAQGGSGGGEPIKIVLLAETTGESSQAIPNYADGAELAEQDLDGAVELVRIPAPLMPSSETENAFLQAVDENPAGIVGFPASSQVSPLGPTIGESGLPFIALSSPEEAQKGGPSGADNLFLVRPLNTLIAREEARYAARDLDEKPETAGLLCVDNPFGTSGCAEAKRVLENQDIEVSVERTNSTTATDLTEQALAMEDVDVVLDFNFPNPLGVFARQLIDNGIDVPHIDGASSGIAVASGSVQGPAAENLVGVEDCVPAEDDRRRVRRWANRYEDEFGYEPLYTSAEAYDAVQMLNAAVEEAGSTDPAAVVEALATMEYRGICTTYQADAGNVLNHASDFVTFDADGDKTVGKHVTVGEGEVPSTETTVATTAPAPSTTP